MRYLIVIGIALYSYSIIVVYDKFLDFKINFSLRINKSFDIPFFFNVSDNSSKKESKFDCLSCRYDNLRRRVADQNFFF